MMEQLTPQMIAGRNLRRLIQENYSSQGEFAEDFGTDVRTVSRYLNKEGLNNLNLIQELASFFKIDFLDFFN